MRAVLAIALAVGAAAQGTPGRPEPAVVGIDAIATDSRGRIVEDLKAADFELLEDGTPRMIEGVRLVRADGLGQAGETLQPINSRADEQVEAARDGARLFAIFLDEYHVAPGTGGARAREALTRLVEQGLGPRDLVVVMKSLDSLLTIRLTRDRNLVRSAIGAFEGRKGDYAPKNGFEKNYIAGSPARIEVVRAQITMSALNAIALHLGSLGAARKTIVVVSEGFPRRERRRGDELLPTLDSVIGAANRASVSIYPIDPRALAGGGVDIAGAPSAAGPSSGESAAGISGGSEMLRALADETNGQAILKWNDVDAGMRRIVSDSSAYYLLTFRPAPNEDGKFHPVQVRVRRPGVGLRARTGYWAQSADELLRVRLAAKAVEPKAPPELPRHISPFIRPWFGLARGADGKTRVSFVWEPVALVPGERVRRQPPARVALRASKADGTAVFEGIVLPAGPAATDRLGAASSEAVFETTPGRLRLQMSIEDATSQVLDTDVRDIAVGALTGPVVLGTAEVLRARNAREYRALDADPGAVPVAAREFSRTERLLIRFPAYGLSETPTLSARLLSRMGKAMRDLPVAPAPTPAGLNQIDLPLAGLAAGEYLVELTAESPAGQAKDLIGFRVTP